MPKQGGIGSSNNSNILRNNQLSPSWRW